MALKLYRFRESALFTKEVTRLLTEENYFALQNFLLESPTEGDVIPVAAVCARYAGQWQGVANAAACA